MSHRSSPVPGDFLTFPLRSLFMSTLVLGGLLLAAPAWASGPEDGEEEEERVGATIMDVALENGALTTRILWSKRTEGLPGPLRLISYNGKEQAEDGVEVRPRPGEVSEVKLFRALNEPERNGWTQKLVLQDANGRVLAVQSYDVNLDCENEEECGFVVSPGIGSGPGVVHVSGELAEALTLIQEMYQDDEFDLVETVVEHFPGLRGEVLVYADQLSQGVGIPGKCSCGFQTQKSHTPAYGAQQYLGQWDTWGWRTGVHGVGATHQITSVVHHPGSAMLTKHTMVAGSSELSLKMSCSKVFYSYFREIMLRFPDNSERAYRVSSPVFAFCDSQCMVEYVHLARLSASTTVSAVTSQSFAYASELATWSVDGGSPLINQAVVGNNSADEVKTASSISNGWSTNRIDSTGVVTVMGSNASQAQASLENSRAAAIYGDVEHCPNKPKTIGIIWDYRTTAGFEMYLSLRETIKTYFFAYHNLDVNP